MPHASDQRPRKRYRHAARVARFGCPATAPAQRSTWSGPRGRRAGSTCAVRDYKEDIVKRTAWDMHTYM